MENQELDQFVGSIIDEKKLEGITDEVRTQLVSDMRDRLLDQINRALIEALPEEKVDELNEMLERDATDDELQTFIGASGVNAQEVAARTMVTFRNLYIGASKSEEQL